MGIPLKNAVYINAMGINCALGNSVAEVARRLYAGDASGMTLQDGWIPGQTAMVGAVTAPLPAIPAHLLPFASRNNQVLLHAAQQIEAQLLQAREHYGAHRIGVVLGTSTTGIRETERFLAGDAAETYCYQLQEQGSPAQFLAEYWQLSGPSWVVSTACSSSARAMIAAQRLLNLNLCDVVISGGVDTLCKLTLNGFSALEAVSQTRCDPFSAKRNGINIGEGAGVFILSRHPLPEQTQPIMLCGGGISMDAHHMSAPDPEGKGAIRAMQAALMAVGISDRDIDYVNLHGTGTRQNDAMESIAMMTVFPDRVACSSTKPLTGHALGAAGAIEAAFCGMTLGEHNPAGQLPPHLWSEQPDPALPVLALTRQDQSFSAHSRGFLMSNSFAFGGNNVSLIFGRAQ